MNDYLYVFALALLLAAGNFAGGVLAEVVSTTRQMLSRALHAAAGILIGVVAIELMPESLGGAAPPRVAVVGLCLGDVCYVVLEKALHALRRSEQASSTWMIYAAVAIDLFSDGLILGVGSVVSLSLALTLASG